MSNSPHDGHRKRLRSKFLSAPATLEDHELLELLLFYSIPRANTNEIAHRLLSRFGSIKGVVNAGLPALKEIDGIGENAALFLRAVSEYTARYERSKVELSAPLTSHEELGAYLRSLFVGYDNEVAFLLLFDSSMRLLLCEKVSEGYSAGNVLSTRTIASIALASNAPTAIIVHNHPGGKPIPSGDDIAITGHIRWFLNSLQIHLIDHFIVAGDECRAILEPQKFKDI